ncbi:hypothetical protein C8F04DRAFT_1191010 [Mycena alexandri]|uniref:Uncharacterized protein n=1 Tax=Mycena alexandri TaxID=1745969 RepID=A0AAD6SH22_9AGAR|nr:hypothetical protein C8F04DRAFT_1191010 [Mycena alexandri]
MSEPAPPGSIVVFKGPLTMARTQAELAAICAALKLTYKGKKKEKLIEEIRSALPGLETDPRFAELYQDQEDVPAKQVKGKRGKKSKSTDKAKADLAEQGKPQKALTGANLKLHQQQNTVDPPASFAPLSLKAKAGADTDEAQEDNLRRYQACPVTLPSPSGNNQDDKNGQAGGAEDEEQEDNPFWNKVSKATEGSANVLVKIHDHNHVGGPAQDILVKGVPVTNFQTPGGDVNSNALLTKLIPMTLQGNSPLKNLVSLTQKITWMSELFAQHLEGTIPNNLEWDRANTFPLEKLDKGVRIRPPPPITSLTGAKSDKPFAIAQARSKVQPTAKTAFIKAENSEELFAVLRAITGSQGLPEKKNNTAAEGCESYIEYQRYFNNFLPFAKKNGGFAFPAPPEVAAAVPTWANLRGHSFTRDQITLSANLTTTATNNNNSLFRSVEALGEEVALWAIEVGAEGDELDSQRRKVLDRKYGSAAWGQFKAWVDRKLAELDSPSKKKKAKKRSLSVSSTESDEPKKKKKKLKAKGKSKARKEADSDDLDGSSGTD